MEPNQLHSIQSSAPRTRTFQKSSRKTSISWKQAKVAPTWAQAEKLPDHWTWWNTAWSRRRRIGENRLSSIPWNNPSLVLSFVLFQLRTASMMEHMQQRVKYSSAHHFLWKIQCIQEWGKIADKWRTGTYRWWRWTAIGNQWSFILTPAGRNQYCSRRISACIRRNRYHQIALVRLYY